MIEALDGSIIAFLNNQLFSKNFKNLTRNHRYEVAQIPVDVAYGTDIENARSIMTDAISKLENYDKTRGFRIVLKELGESGVQLRVVIWLPVATKLYAMGDIYEAVYNAFNANGISMPFPQRDIHIIEDMGEEEKSRWERITSGSSQPGQV